MKQALRALTLLIGLIAGFTPAIAQQFPTVPDHSVLGRIGVGGSSGPSQAIPWSIFLSNLGGVQAANTVWAGPTSGGTNVPTFRLLVGADIPVPGASSLGGVKSLTCSASNWFNTLSTAGAFGCSQPAFSDITGTVAAGQLPNPTASTLGGVKSLAAVSHNFLTSISTVGQPTQAQPACTDLSDATSCNAARGQLPGETSTGSASAGNVGEYISTTLATGSAVALTTATPANVTSISLTAGDWDVTANVNFKGGGTTTVTYVEGSLSTTSATLDTSVDRIFVNYFNGTAAFSTSPGIVNVTPGPARFSLSGTTTIFLVAQSVFGTSTASAFGIIRARRVR